MTRSTAQFVAGCLVATLCAMPSHASNEPPNESSSAVFGPRTYLRTAGPPNIYEETFAIPADIRAPYVLRVVNGDAKGKFRVSSATVSLNGVEVLKPKDFSQKVDVIDRTVGLRPTNVLRVSVASIPGSYLTISVLGVPVPPPPPNRAPSANAGGPYTITAGQPLTFNGSGTDPDGDPLTFSWAFGDGTTGASASPSHTYAAAGEFTASLTVDDGRGGRATAPALVTVTAMPPPPNRAPSANAGGPYTITAGQSLTLNGSGSDPDSDPLTFAWTFGDGASGAGASPSHTYAAAGEFTASLTVDDGRGGRATATALVTVTAMPPPPNRAPSANAGGPYTITAGQPLTFNGSGSDPDSDPLTFAWTFGDGASGAGASASHTYASAGDFTATLTVSDGRGGTATATALVTVSAIPPPPNREPSANAGGPYTITAGQPLTFNGSGSDPDSDPLTFAWTFGDGASGAGASPSHTYAAAGDFTASLTVDDGRGGRATATALVTVTAMPPPPNRAPSANAGGPYTITAGQPLTFNGSGSDPDSDPLTFAWTFGDGASGAGASASHTYAAAGDFTATLTVSDERGGTATATALVTVSAIPPPPNRAPSANAGGPYTITAGQPLTFNGSGSDPDSDPLTFAWTFGDGASGAGTSASHTYASAGDFTATLTVSDGRGGTATATALVTVSAIPPPPNRAPSANAGGPYTITAGQPLTFNGSGSDPDGDPLTFGWTFGDGTTGAGASPSHTYAAAGDFTATLTVDDGRGGTATATALVTVTAIPPPPNRAPSANAGGPYTITAGQLLTFNGSGSDPDSDPLTFGWTFGDGTTGAGASPSHPYAAAGDFTATLTVDDGRGGTAAATALVTVTLIPPPPNRAPSANAGGPYTITAGQLLTFNGSGSDPDSDPLTFGWTFGDGTTGAGASPSHTYAAAGDFTATLTVDDGRGGTAAATALVTVTAIPPPPNRAPSANAGGPYTITAGQLLTFNGSGSDPDSDPLTFGWTFGDGTTGAGASPSHTYVAAGDFTATLTVTDGRGGTDSAAASITVVAPAPNRAPSITSTPITTGGHQHSYSYQASASDPDGDPVTFSLSAAPSGLVVGPTTGLVAWIPSAGQIGVHPVVLVVTDSRGASSTQSFDITVVDATAPVVSLSLPSQVLPGATVTATAIATDDVGVVAVRFEVNGANPIDLVTAPFARAIVVPANALVGTEFHVRAVARDAAGNLGLSDRVVRVAATPDVQPPVLSLNVAPQASPGATVRLTVTVTDNVGVKSVVFRVGGALVRTDSEAPFEATFTVPADAAVGSTIDVTARAFDFSDNFTETAGSSQVVALPDTTPPTVQLLIAPTVLEGATATISATAADNVGVASVSFFVNGVNVGAAASEPYRARFALPAALTGGAVLNVEARAVDFSGLTATSAGSIEVLSNPNRAPTASAGGPYAGEIGELIRFSAGTSSDPDSTDHLSYDWDFGDQTTGSGLSPGHAYATEGSFTVTVVVSDGRGGNASSQAIVTVAAATDRDPPSITINGPASVLPGSQVTMTAQASDDRGVAGVAFEVNGGASTEAPGPPYQQVVNVPSVASPGDRIIVRATARDAAGNRSTAERAITIGSVPDTERPVVAINAPPTAVGGTTMQLSATVSDNVGVQSVSFTVNGVVVVTLPGPPFEVGYPVPANAPAGSSLGVLVQATDFNGNRGEASGLVSVVPLADSDMTPPSISLSASLQVVAGRTLALSAQAQDNVGIATVRFFVNSVNVVTFTSPPFAFTYAPGLSQPAGTVLNLRAEVVDLSGLSASDASQTLVVSSASAGQGVLTGEVYDDRSGLPLAGAAVLLTGADTTGETYTASTLSDARGRWVLRATEGQGVVQITKPGWTRVDRPTSIAVNQALELLDARLTLLSAPATSVSAVLGGSITWPVGPGPPAQLSVPPGALPTATSLSLTPLTQQGLAGLLPAGWSPVAMADIMPADVTFATDATLSLPNAFSIADGVTLVVARWDEEAAAWRAVGSIVSSESGPLVAEIQRTGQFVLLKPDLSPLAPPFASAGDLVEGVSLSALALDASTLIDPQPRVLFYRPGVQSKVRGTITSPAPISSGLSIEARVVESYSFLSGTNVRPEAFVEDLVFYQVGGPASGLGAVFAVTPSQTFDPLTLQQGVITVELLAPPPGPRVGSTLGPDGGSVAAQSGEALQVPQGAVASSLPISVRGLTPANVGVTLPPGISVVGAALVSFSGTLDRPATLSAPKPASLAGTTRLLLVRPQEIGGETKLVLVGRGVIVGEQIRSDTTLNGADVFEGIRVGGRYFFISAASAFGFARGQVSGPAGGPFAGALVSAADFPVVSLSGASGAYISAALVGPVALTAWDLVNADSGAASGDLASAGGVLPLDVQITASLPRVTAVVPADGAANVALSDPIVIRFSKPIAGDSINGQNAGNVRLVRPDGTPVGASISLTGGNSVVTLRPAGALNSNTVYSVVVATGVTDLAGRNLANEVTAQFTSLDTQPPPMPAAGSINAVIPGTDGFTTLTATQGTAAIHDTVTVVNLTTRTTSPVLLDPNGGFVLRVAAGITDVLQITITDRGGNQTVVAVPRFRQTNADGSISTAVTAQGGRVEGPGGVSVEVPVGAFPEGTVVTLKPVTEAQFPVQLTAEQRQVFQYTGGVSIDLGGKTPLSYLNVSIAPTGGETLEDQWIVGQVAYLNGQVFLDTADTARMIDGRIRTSSPPCPGVTGSGVYGFLKAARPLGVTYTGIPNPNSQLSGQLLVAAIVPMALVPGTLRIPIFMPAVAGGALAMAEAVHAEFLNQSRQVCMPLLSGRTTIVSNKVRLLIPTAQLTDDDSEIRVKNLSTFKEDRIFPHYDGTVTVDGSNADTFQVQAIDSGPGRSLSFTVEPRSFLRVTVAASVFASDDTLIQIKNVTRNTNWSSGLSGATVRPLGDLTAIVEGATGDTLVVEVTGAGIVRTVSPSVQPYPFGNGNLLLRTTPGTIDPTQAEIDAHNSRVPASERIGGPPVTQVLLMKPGGNSEVILDVAAGNTSRVATGALTYAFNGLFTERYSLQVRYENGRVDTVDIPTFHITVRSGLAGSVVEDIIGQVPPRGEPLRIDLGANGAPATLATEGDGFFHVEVQSPLTLSFSQGLDAQSVRDYMKLKVLGNPSPIPGTWQLTNGNRTATFVPAGPLQMGKTYRVVLSGVTAGGRPLSVVSVPVKTFEPVKLSSVALPLPHSGTGSVVNASVLGSPFGDVEILRRQVAGGPPQTTVVASTTNQQGLKYHNIDVTNPRVPVEVGHTAGGMPKRLRAVRGIQRPPVDILYDVPLVAQQTMMSCWAAGAAMIVAFRDQVSVDPFAIATVVGQSSSTSYWNQYSQGLKQSTTDAAGLFATWGLIAEPAQTYTVDAFRLLLEQYGPLWVGSLSSVGGHVRVVTGLIGDGTPDGTYVQINDPWEPGMLPFRLPNAGGQYPEKFVDFVDKQEQFARRLYGDEQTVRNACAQGHAGACNVIGTKLTELRACNAGDQTACDDPLLQVVGAGAFLVAHLPARPPHSIPTGPVDAGLPLRGGVQDLRGIVPPAADRIDMLGTCAQNVSIGPAGDPVFTGDLLVAPLYSSFGSSVNFFDVTDRANPCILGGRPLTRNPETVPPPGGPDNSARGTLKQYGFARGAAILPFTNTATSNIGGLMAYIAVAELGLMPVSIGGNIPDVSPLARPAAVSVYPGDYVDVVSVGEHLLALNNNFGGTPSIDVVDASLSPIGSVSFEANRSGFSKVHQLIAAKTVFVRRPQSNGTFESQEKSLAFVAGADGITIVDVSDFEHMLVIGKVPMPGIIRQLALSKDGKILFAGGDHQAAGGTRLFVIDVSNPFSPFLIDINADGEDDRIMFSAPYLPSTQGEIAGIDYDDSRGVAYVGSERSLDVWAIKRGAVLANNRAPIADAGPDAAVDPDSTITLNGTGSHDPDGDPLTYSWIQVSGPSVSLAGSLTALSSFMTTGLSDVTLTFQLVVRDAVASSPGDRVIISVKRKERLTLTPVIAPIVVLPGGTSQLTATLEDANGTAIDVSANPQTSYKWITAGGLVPGVDNVPNVTAILNQMSAKLGVAVQLADITINASGTITASSPGIQFVRAIHRVGTRDIKSALTVVLAGFQLSDITLKPLSAPTLLVGAVATAIGAKQNPPMILASSGNGYLLTTGVIVLDDVTFKFAGTAKISMGDLLDAIRPAIAIAMNAVVPVGGAVAAPVLVEAFRFLAGLVGTQFLDPIESSETSVATVTTQAPFKGVVSSHAPGLAAISGTLSLGVLGTADDSVLAWVLPGLDSVKVEPNLTAIKVSEPASPGPTVRTFAESTAISSAVVPLTGKGATAAELLDRFLPGGLASWSAGIDRNFFTNEPVPGLRFRVRGGMTPSCSGPDAAGKMTCSIGFSNVGLGFYVPNIFRPLIDNDYTFATPSVAQIGQAEMFDTHVVHQNTTGESSVLGHVAITGIGSADDPTARVVVGDGPVLTKALASGAASAQPGAVLDFVITATNPFRTPLTGVVVTDTLYFQATGATSESVVRTQTFSVGTLLPGESRTIITSATVPGVEGALRNEVSAGGSVSSSARCRLEFLAPPVPRPMLNEIVVGAQRDWNDSGPGGDGVPFNNVPGTSVAPSPAVTIADEWFEFLTNTGSPLELTNWTLSFLDASLAPVTLTLTPAILSTQAGSPYVIVVAPTGISPTSVITLSDTTGQVVDSISLATIIATLGPATGVANEAIARSPDGVQTHQPTDFQRRPASIGRVNP